MSTFAVSIKTSRFMNSNKYICLVLSTQGKHQYDYLKDNAVMQAFVDARKAADYYKQKTKEYENEFEAKYASFPNKRIDVHDSAQCISTDDFRDSSTTFYCHKGYVQDVIIWKVELIQKEIK